MKAKIYPINTLPSEAKLISSAFCLHVEILCASLSSGSSKIINTIESEDINLTISWCEKLGAVIKKAPNRLIIKGVNNKVSFQNSLFFSESLSTTAKLMIPLLACVSQPIGIKTESNIIEELRPYQKCFEKLGVSYYEEKDTIRIEKGLKSGNIELTNPDIYMLTGLLIALSMLPGESKIKIEESISIHQNFYAIVKILKHFSVDIKHVGKLFVISGNQRFKACKIVTENDYFYSSYIAMLCKLLKDNKEKLLISNNNSFEYQNEYKLFEIMKKNIIVSKSKYFKKKDYHFTKFDALLADNILPILMVAATFNDQDVGITNVNKSNKKVFTQYQIMKKAFNKLGLNCSIVDNSIVVKPSSVTSKQQVDSCNDPYIVMALSILALLSTYPIVIRQAECVYKINLEFFNLIKELGAKVELIYN